MSVRAFSAALDTPASTTRNYLDKGTKPSTDYIERIAEHFNTVNIHWLITGQGEHFLSTAPQTSTTQTGNLNQAGNSNKQTIKGTKGGVQANSGGNNTINVQLDNCQRDLVAATKEVELLRQQLTMAQALLEAKEETLSLLRAGHNRPN
jgi:phage repressor protein C with HTH and peptisase S24 domain